MPELHRRVSLTAAAAAGFGVTGMKIYFDVNCPSPRGGRASKSSGIERAQASDVRAHSSSSKLEHQMIKHIQVRANIEHQILKKILDFWSLE